MDSQSPGPGDLFPLRQRQPQRWPPRPPAWPGGATRWPPPNGVPVPVISIPVHPQPAARRSAAVLRPRPIHSATSAQDPTGSRRGVAL